MRKDSRLTRLTHCAKNSNLSLEDFAKLPDSEILRVPNLGLKSLSLLRKMFPSKEELRRYPAVGGFADGKRIRDHYMYRLEEINFDSDKIGKMTFKFYVYKHLDIDDALMIMFGDLASRKRAKAIQSRYVSPPSRNLPPLPNVES